MPNTGINGSGTFPATANDIYGLIETLAVQNIRDVKSTNRIVDGFYDYEIDNGKVIEEAIIEMAKAQAFDKNAYSFAPTDPTVQVRYFNNFEGKQYATTVRRDDIRAILANKGTGVEDVVARIIGSLGEGESNQDFIDARNALYASDMVNYRSIIGGVPASVKGVIYALRDMYNHVKCNNDDLTAVKYVSATPEEDIRIAVSTKLMNLIDVIELASIFNLEKEELFGKLVIIDVDDLTDHTYDYFAFVYDRKAMGRATRLYEYTQDISGKGRFTNHYLTTERAYFHNGLFKGCYLDCTEACSTAKATIIGNPTSYTVTKTLSHATTASTVVSVYQNESYSATFTAASGYVIHGDGSAATVTMGGTAITDDALTISADYKTVTVNVPHVTGNLVITITGVSAA